MTMTLPAAITPSPAFQAVPGQRIDPELARHALRSGASPLTERERAVLVEAEHGGSTSDIAGRLHLSRSTVRNYLSGAIGKTATRTRTEAARVARRNGWL